MAAGDHVLPVGTTLSYGPATGSESITLTDLVKVAFGEVKLGVSDDSDLSTVIGINTPGLGKPGELQNQLFLTASQYSSLLTVRQNRLNQSWKVQLPKSANQSSSGSKVQYTGSVLQVKINQAEKMKDDKLLYDLVIQQSGDETFTSGS